jgi:A/G-specific adenine glycosylase
MNSKLKVSDKLKSWYLKNYRDFPWRKTDDPYKIWISEVMLQQTTSTAVIPFYEKFLERFPTIQSLSKSKIEDVYECWAGLGYYSRARNLHKAAVALAKTKFPESWKELIIYPGFGPYTARAVSSFAFDENVGVLDGNVIRFTSR